MGFMDAVKSVFGQYANFSGRARRSEYWYFVLFNFLISFVLGFIGGLLGEKIGTVFTVISGLWSLVVLIPSLAVAWRRLHDIGRSGAYFLLILIPLVGAILLIVWFCQPGQPGDNQYGPDPKGSYTGY